jgi:hypothetical protein
MKLIFQKLKGVHEQTLFKGQFLDIRDIRRTSSISLPRGLHFEFVCTVAVSTEIPRSRFAFTFIDFKSNVFSDHFYPEIALETHNTSAAAFWWLDNIT